jgi:serine/threonine protein kinase
MNHMMPSPNRQGSGASVLQNSGFMVGPYEILQPLAEGGMAQVFLCVRRGAGQFEKRVVLKVLHPKFLDNPEYVTMFIQEARMLARLQHPNIVDVYEVEQVDRSPYLAMEYVNGPTLGYLHRRATEVEDHQIGYLLHVMVQVCLGLHHAHTLVVDGRPAGMVHRDVSSHNILIDAATGTAKLIDFGIAKEDDEDAVTRIGVLKGKLPYMAPEVLRGKRADARADIFAVGVLLYRLVTDRLPFGNGDDFWATRLSGEYPRPSEVSDRVSPQMEAIIDRAMRVSPEQRYQTAEELANDLSSEIARMGTNVRSMPQWIKAVFPRGEAEWSRRPGMTKGTMHSALSHLLTQGGSGAAETQQRRWLPMVAAAGLSGILGTGLLAVGIAALVALGPVTSGRAEQDVVTYLDAADELIRKNQIEAARSMNTRAEALGVEDVDLVLRLVDQQGAIERREAVLRASDRIQAGELEEARRILVSTLERHPSDAELSSQLETLDQLVRAAAKARATGPTPRPSPTEPVEEGSAPAAKAKAPAESAPVGSPSEAPAAVPPVPADAIAPAVLEVVTIPPSLIVLDGALMGFAPLAIPGLEPGAHVVEARLDGYRATQAPVELSAGESSSVELVLEPLSPAPVAPAPAPAPARDAVAPTLDLPPPSDVRTPYAMHAALAPIQESLVSSGVDPALAKAVLADLEGSNTPRLEAGQVVRVNPAAIHELVLAMARAGAARRDIQTTLRKSFQSGALD